LQCAELRIWQGAAMDAKNNNRKLVWSAVVMEPLNQ
jgi:hypothetical protein